MSESIPLNDFERRILCEIDRLSSTSVFKRVPSGVLRGSLCDLHNVNGKTVLLARGDVDAALEKLRIAGIIKCQESRLPSATPGIVTTRADGTIDKNAICFPTMHTRPDGRIVLVKYRREPKRDADFGGACCEETVLVDGEKVYWRLTSTREHFALTAEGIREARRGGHHATATPGESGGDYGGYVPADTLEQEEGIRPNRLSEAAGDNKVKTKPAPNGLRDSQGREIRTLYHRAEAIRHCKPKRMGSLKLNHAKNARR